MRKFTTLYSRARSAALKEAVVLMRMMINRRVWILCSVATLLAIIAILQYRWIVEASRAEQGRLKQNLELATNRFVQEFESEFFHPGFGARVIGAGAAIRFRDDPQEDPSARLARQYREWITSSRDPELFQDLFITRILSPHDVGLFRFDPDSRKLVPADWPAEFSTFRAFCFDALEQPDPMFRQIEIPSLENVPALIFPFGPPVPNGFSGPSEWEIVRINRTAFQRVLSRLVEENFPQRDDFKYDILIAQNATNEVFYRSLPHLNLDAFRNSSDISRTLNSPPGPHFATMSIAVGSVHMPPPPEPAFVARFPGDGMRGWQFYAKHHSGSLESFAQQFRLRNLVVSSAALALLATGLAFALVASERSRAIGKMHLEFAAGLSHELRTPLTVIRSAGYNLVHGNVARREDIVRYGNMIQQEGTRLSDMVEQALLFAQTQSGRYQYACNLVEVGSVVQDAVQSCSEIVTKYSGAIVCDVAHDLPPALTDSRALSQCIRNLLVNALKYGDESSPIHVSAQSKRQPQNVEIEISVTNKGRAIDPRDLPHIFEPFFRGKNASGTAGNGLGLHVVESIMKSLGGRIEASSSAAETRLALYVPASPK